jgi:hypothetical protein
VDREGESKIYYFSVTSDSGDVYKIHFNAGDMTWTLDMEMVEA